MRWVKGNYVLAGVALACCCKATPPMELSTDQTASVQIQKGWAHGVLVLDRRFLAEDFRIGLSLSGADLGNEYRPPCYEVGLELRCDDGNPREFESRWPVTGPVSHLPFPAWCPGVGSTFGYSAVVTADADASQEVIEAGDAVLGRPASCLGREHVRVVLRPLRDFREDEFLERRIPVPIAQVMELTDWCAVP